MAPGRSSSSSCQDGSVDELLLREDLKGYKAANAGAQRPRRANRDRMPGPTFTASGAPGHIAGDSADDPVIGTVTEIQGQLTTWLDAIDVWWIIAAFTLTAGTALALRTARRTRSGDDHRNAPI